MDNAKEQECAEVHNTIWKIADDFVQKWITKIFKEANE